MMKHDISPETKHVNIAQQTQESNGSSHQRSQSDAKRSMFKSWKKRISASALPRKKIGDSRKPRVQSYDPSDRDSDIASILVEYPEGIKTYVALPITSAQRAKKHIANKFGLKKATIQLKYQDDPNTNFKLLTSFEGLNLKSIVIKVNQINLSSTWTFSQDFINENEWEPVEAQRTLKNRDTKKLKIFDALEDDPDFLEPLAETVMEIFESSLEGEGVQVTKIFAVQNHAMLTNFESNLNLLRNDLIAREKQGKSKKKSGWRAKQTAKDYNLRLYVYEKYEDLVGSYDWNVHRKMPVIPMVFGNKEDIVWQQTQPNRLSKHSSMHLLSNATQAINRFCIPNADGERVISINYIAPGTVFPYVGSKAKASRIKKPYNSQFSVVDSLGVPITVPPIIEDDSVGSQTYSELYINHEFQMLPRYVLYIKPRKDTFIAPAPIPPVQQKKTPIAPELVPIPTPPPPPSPPPSVKNKLPIPMPPPAYKHRMRDSVKRKRYAIRNPEGLVLDDDIQDEDISPTQAPAPPPPPMLGANGKTAKEVVGALEASEENSSLPIDDDLFLPGDLSLALTSILHKTEGLETSTSSMAPSDESDSGEGVDEGVNEGVRESELSKMRDLVFSHNWPGT